MGRNFKILITLFLLTVLYGLYYFGTPAIVNISQRTDLIESAVFKETGLKVEITNPSLKMGLKQTVLQFSTMIIQKHLMLKNHT